MLMLDATLVSTDQPSLEQRGDEVDARHDFVRRVGAVAEDRDLMLVTGRRQSGITSPAVGVNHRPALHSALDEGKQTVCRDISDLLKADAAKPPAVLLDCYGDDGLALGFSASCTAIPLPHPWGGLPCLSAMGAGEPLRPAQTTDILPAGLVVTEAFVHSLKRARVIKSSEGVSSGVHPTSVPDPQGAVKGIPIKRNSFPLDGGGKR